MQTILLIQIRLNLLSIWNRVSCHFISAPVGIANNDRSFFSRSNAPLSVFYRIADFIFIFFNVTETYIVLFFSNSIIFRIVLAILLALI